MFLVRRLLSSRIVHLVFIVPLFIIYAGRAYSQDIELAFENTFGIAVYVTLDKAASPSVCQATPERLQLKRFSSYKDKKMTLTLCPGVNFNTAKITLTVACVYDCGAAPFNIVHEATKQDKWTWPGDLTLFVRKDEFPPKFTFYLNSWSPPPPDDIR